MGKKEAHEISSLTPGVTWLGDVKILGCSCSTTVVRSNSVRLLFPGFGSFFAHCCTLNCCIVHKHVTVWIGSMMPDCSALFTNRKGLNSHQYNGCILLIYMQGASLILACILSDVVFPASVVVLQCGSQKYSRYTYSAICLT